MNILGVPAPLENNALQPMHHHVGGDFALLAALGYDGGGDLNTCRWGVI